MRLLRRPRPASGATEGPHRAPSADPYSEHTYAFSFGSRHSSGSASTTSTTGFRMRGTWRPTFGHFKPSREGASTMTSASGNALALLTNTIRAPSAQGLHRRVADAGGGRHACVYLSMNSSALGTLWSPRWMTALPTHCPSCCARTPAPASAQLVPDICACRESSKFAGQQMCHAGCTLMRSLQVNTHGGMAKQQGQACSSPCTYASQDPALPCRDCCMCSQRARTRWQRARMACMARDTFGACCTRFSPCPVLVSRYALPSASRSPSARLHSLNICAKAVQFYTAVIRLLGCQACIWRPTKMQRTATPLCSSAAALPGSSWPYSACKQGAARLVADLAPQREALQHVVELPLVAVREPRALHAAVDGQRAARLSPLRAEERAQVGHHAVHRIAVEQQVAVVVRDAVQAAQDGLLRRPASAAVNLIARLASSTCA